MAEYHYTAVFEPAPEGGFTVTVPALPLTAIASLPLVPLTMTLSAWPSPVPLPAGDARSIFTRVTAVPLRSPTLMASAPPRAWGLTTLWTPRYGCLPPKPPSIVCGLAAGFVVAFREKTPPISAGASIGPTAGP